MTDYIRIVTPEDASAHGHRVEKGRLTLGKNSVEYT